MSRIQLTDNVMDIVVKMADGNPGAITAIMELHANEAKIDPNSAFSQFGIGTIMSLDNHQIYGSAIYILWSDKCQRDVRKLIMLLRAVQLGLLSESKLQDMANDQMREIDLTTEEWKDIDTKVCTQLPLFQKA